MKKLSVILTILILSGCNLTSKDFYTTEPVLTGGFSTVMSKKDKIINEPK